MARGTRVQRKYKLPGGKSRKMLNVKIAAFFIMMLIFGVIALIIPLRPTESVVEKRELTKFPEFSFQALADGSSARSQTHWQAHCAVFPQCYLYITHLIDGTCIVRQMWE